MESCQKRAFVSDSNKLSMLIEISHKRNEFLNAFDSGWESIALARSPDGGIFPRMNSTSRGQSAQSHWHFDIRSETSARAIGTTRRYLSLAKCETQKKLHKKCFLCAIFTGSNYPVPWRGNNEKHINEVFFPLRSPFSCLASLCKMIKNSNTTSASLACAFRQIMQTPSAKRARFFYQLTSHDERIMTLTLEFAGPIWRNSLGPLSSVVDLCLKAFFCFFFFSRSLAAKVKVKIIADM